MTLECVYFRKRGRDIDLTVQNKRNWLTSSYASQLPDQMFKEEERLFCFTCGMLRLLLSEIS